MAKYHLRIIADCHSPDASEAIVSFLTESHFASEPSIEPIKPYWKQPELGELVFSFHSARPIEEIQAILADHWEGEVADSRWSRIFVPHAVFIWLTT